MLGPRCAGFHRCARRPAGLGSAHRRKDFRHTSRKSPRIRTCLQYRTRESAAQVLAPGEPRLARPPLPLRLIYSTDSYPTGKIRWHGLSLFETIPRSAGHRCPTAVPATLLPLSGFTAGDPPDGTTSLVRPPEPGVAPEGGLVRPSSSPDSWARSPRRSPGSRCRRHPSPDR